MLFIVFVVICFYVFIFFIFVFENVIVNVLCVVKEMLYDIKKKYVLCNLLIKWFNINCEDN